MYELNGFTEGIISTSLLETCCDVETSGVGV